MTEKSKIWSSHYIPPSKKMWEGRKDSDKPERFHQSVKLFDLNKDKTFPTSDKIIALLGFQSDEGIKRNYGRAGAYDGPDAIRKALANLPFISKQPLIVVDVGNIHCNDGNLEESQKQLGFVVAELHKYGATPLLLGGGHEIAWGHFQGISKTYSNDTIAIVNFDAHYDLRPISQKGKGNSGTSFTQIATDLKNRKLLFHYYCFGIQKTGNTKSLLDAADEFNVKTIFAENFFFDSDSAPRTLLEEILNNHSHVYITVCMDVFSAAYAPGVSAPQPLGLTPWQIIPLLRIAAGCGKIIGVDFAELSPPLDYDGRTAKLTASLISEVIANF